MPYHQIVDMICALQSAGVSEDNYETLTITVNDSSEHAFQYWDSWDGLDTEPTRTIAGDVIRFLDAHLK